MPCAPPKAAPPHVRIASSVTATAVSVPDALASSTSNWVAALNDVRLALGVRLEITDTGGAKGVMALAGFAAIEEDKQTQSGYEKTYHQNGRMIHEEWNNSGSGEFTVILGDRFVVAVHGSGVANVDALKAAVAGLNLAGLEALKSAGVKKG